VRVGAAAIAIVVLVVRVAVAGTPTQQLDKGRTLYKSGDWEQAKIQLNDLLYPKSKLAQKQDIWEAYVLLGASAYALGDRERAVIEFKKALELEFDRTITTNFYSAEVVQLFEDTKARVKFEHDRDAARREDERRQQQIRDYINTIGVYEKNSYGVNFVPFAAQIQNKQPTKAYLFGGAMAITGGISLATFVYLAGTYGLEAKVPIEDGARVRRLQQIEVGTGIAFFTIYIVGVVDAIIHYQPNRLVRGDDSLIPPELRPTPKPASPDKKQSSRRGKRSRWSRLHIGPLLAPNVAGLGLSWETD